MGAKSDRPKTKDHKRLFKIIAAHGGSVRRGGSMHYKVYNAHGHLVCAIPCSGSDWRGDKNLVAQLRRAGLYPQAS